ncbi:MAG: amidohydrolase family protein [Candidatus Fermentibacterota bacterium]
MRIECRAVAAPDGKLHDGGFALKVDDGRIGSISPAAADGELARCVAVPGLVQAHVHLCQTLLRGMAEDRTLLPWLEERIWPLEAAHDAETTRISALLSLREMLAAGCTGLLDMGSVRHSEATVGLLRDSGVRARAGNSLMDRGPEGLAGELEWLGEETARVRAACGGLVGYAWTPRFALSCSDALWEWVAGESEGQVRTTHSSESPEETEHPAIAGAGGNVWFLQQRGFLGSGTLLAHCVQLRPGEKELLASTGTSVVHCPWTNLRLGSGIADVPALDSAGVRVALGSDGAPCNNGLDLAADLRLAMSLASIRRRPSGLSGDFWLRAATESAAQALGWPDVGRLQEGWRADIVLLEPTEAEWQQMVTGEDPVRALLELHWPSRVRMTMVDGRVLYRDGEYPTLPPLPGDLAPLRRQLARRAGIGGGWE